MESVPLVKELGCMDMKITKGRHYKASSADIYGWDRWTLEETKWFLAISVIKMSDDTSMVVDGFFSCQDKMGYVVKWNTDPEDNPLEFPSPRAGVSVRKLPLWAFRGYSSVTVTVFRRRDRATAINLTARRVIVVPEVHVFIYALRKGLLQSFLPCLQTPT